MSKLPRDKALRNEQRKEQLKQSIKKEKLKNWLIFFVSLIISIPLFFYIVNAFFNKIF